MNEDQVPAKLFTSCMILDLLNQLSELFFPLPLKKGKCFFLTRKIMSKGETDNYNCLYYVNKNIIAIILDLLFYFII